MEDDPACVYRRKSIEFKDFEKFKLSSKCFEKQFSSIYQARLAALRDHVLQKAKVKWGEYEVVTISKLSEKSQDELSIVIGTLYKHQELKPSILRELSEELQLIPQPTRSNYGSFKDTLFLEDEMLRIKLVDNHESFQNVVTGLVCAVLGRILENGEFAVTDWCFPGYCPLRNMCDSRSQKGGKVLLISGLNLRNNLELLSLNLLSEWITGMVGSKDSQKEGASVGCVIIAGNSVRGSMETHNHKSYFETKAHDEAIFKDAAHFTHKLDSFLHPIAQCCPIILMPGEYDPVCYTIPQQPFHPCILPQSSRFKSFHAVTNPWIGTLNTRVMAGSSGQPIKDIMKVAGLEDVSPLTWLKQTLDWRHFSPTAPDTLPAYPYFGTDPFIMTECPDVYFAGNMEKYDTELMEADDGQTIRLICIPKFSETQLAVLVDLEDLSTSSICFGIS